MTDQIFFKRDRSSLIEEDSHLRGSTAVCLDFREALFGVLKHSRDLLGCHAGKPFEKLINGRARFQVLEEGSHWDASPAENPRAA